MESWEELDRSDLIDEYETRVSELAEGLNLLRSDLELRQEGYKFFYAVDFSELFAYGYPLTDVTIRTVGESQKDAYARQRIALAFIFHALLDGDGLESLILLPPYALEMRDHLALVQNGAIVLNKQLQLLKTMNQSLFGADEHTAEIRQILSKHENNEKLTEEEHKFLVEYTKDYYKDLWVILTSGTKEGGRRIGTLIETHRVMPLGKFDNLAINTTELKGTTGQWFKEIERQRPRRAYPNYIDSIACEYIRRINEKINGKREILLFITRSPTMKDVLGTKPVALIKYDRKSLHPVRDLGYFLLYMMCRHKSYDEMLSEVENSQKLVQTFQSTVRELEKLEERREDQPTVGEKGEVDIEIEVTMRHIETLITDIKARFESYENLRLSIQTDRHLLESSLHDKELMWEERLAENAKIAERVIRLLTGESEIIEELRLEAEKLREQLMFDEVKLEGLLNWKLLDLPQLCEVYRRPHKDYATRLSGLLGGMTRTIQFSDQEVEKVIGQVCGVAPVDASGVLSSGLDSLLRLIFGKEEHVEAYLAWSYIQAMRYNFEVAARIVGEGLRLCKERARSPEEFLFLKAVILSNFRDPQIEEAILACEGAIKAKGKEDPRYYREMAFLIWRYLKEQEMKKEGEELFKPRYTISDCIDYAEKALDIVGKDVELRSLIYSDIARYHAERDKEGDLGKAAQAFMNLKKYCNEKDWLPFFYHTYGFVMYKRARIPGPDTKKSQTEALDYLKLALKHSEKMSHWERELIKHELDKARKME